MARILRFKWLDAGDKDDYMVLGRTNVGSKGAEGAMPSVLNVWPPRPFSKRNFCSVYIWASRMKNQ